MTFWPRLLCATVSWLLTMLALLAIANYYWLPVPVSMSLLVRLLQALAAGVTSIIVMVGTLAFWLWVWIRR